MAFVWYVADFNLLSLCQIAANKFRPHALLAKRQDGMEKYLGREGEGRGGEGAQPVNYICRTLSRPTNKLPCHFV